MYFPGELIYIELAVTNEEIFNGPPCCRGTLFRSFLHRRMRILSINPLVVELKGFPTDQARKTIESSGRKNNCTLQAKANSLKMIDGVSLLFQIAQRAYGSEIANEQ